MDEYGFFANGKFDSYSLFQGEMNLSIYAEDGASEEDAIRCINHYNGLLEKPNICNQIQECLEKFFLYMYDEWCNFDDFNYLCNISNDNIECFIEIEITNDVASRC